MGLDLTVLAHYLEKLELNLCGRDSAKKWMNKITGKSDDDFRIVIQQIERNVMGLKKLQY